MARHGTTRHDTARHGTTRHDTAQHGMTWHNTTQHEMAIAQSSLSLGFSLRFSEGFALGLSLVLEGYFTIGSKVRGRTSGP